MKAPKHLKKRGADFFRAVAAEYGLSDTGALALLISAAECLDRLTAAQDAITTHGEVVTDRYGALKLNPALTLEKDARNGFLSAMRALDLDIQPPKPRGRPAGTFNAGR